MPTSAELEDPSVPDSNALHERGVDQLRMPTSAERVRLLTNTDLDGTNLPYHTPENVVVVSDLRWRSQPVADHHHKKSGQNARLHHQRQEKGNHENYQNPFVFDRPRRNWPDCC
jgi:hypothetical protein